MAAPAAPEPAFRVDPPYAGAERPMLDAWLDYHRGTLLWKCDGLSADELARRSVEPSTMSLLGLVRHMAEVERWWFRTIFLGEPDTQLFCSDEYPDGDFDLTDPARAQDDLATFRAEVDRARQATVGHGLDEISRGRHPRRRDDISLRWIYLHMIEEYARHNGHADLLRERVDGATGD